MSEVRDEAVVNQNAHSRQFLAVKSSRSPTSEFGELSARQCALVAIFSVDFVIQLETAPIH
jgi:hypothetical protein